MKNYKAKTTDGCAILVVNLIAESGFSIWQSETILEEAGKMINKNNLIRPINIETYCTPEGITQMFEVTKE